MLTYSQRSKGSHNAHSWKSDIEGPLANDEWGARVNVILSCLRSAEKNSLQKTLNSILSELAECQIADLDAQDRFVNFNIGSWTFESNVTIDIYRAKIKFPGAIRLTGVNRDDLRKIICPSLYLANLYKLNAGIRYFDLRVNWRQDRNEFWCAHAVYTSSLRHRAIS